MTTLEGPPLEEAEGIGALTLAGFLGEVCARYHRREALVFDDPLLHDQTQRWTYGELEERAHQVAAGLIAGGVPAGARVGILMGNRPDAVAAIFGAALTGAVAVPMSTFSPPAELAFMVEQAEIVAVLTQAAMGNRCFVEDLPATGLVAAIGDGSWDRFLAAGEAVGDDVVETTSMIAGPGDEALIVYSSGTTAHPKGVRHTHRAVTLQFWLEAQAFGRQPETRLWTSLPLFWTAGLNTGGGPTLAAGGCWVMQEKFEPGPALALMAREKVTEPYTLPHQTAALVDDPGWAGADLSSLKYVFGKSAFARHPSVHGDTRWNMPVAYGMSETGTSFASHRWDTPRELLKESSGRLLPGNRLRVHDPDSGSELGPGEVGELAVAGPTVMIGYVGTKPEDSFDRDGFFHTGDVGYFDREGYVHWTGRRSEMIKTGGASVSPAEIEVALRAYPALKLARVVGVPDERLGQIPVLCAVRADGADPDERDIQLFLRERISSYKVPKRVLFFADGEIPMTASGTKVRDNDLMSLVEARLAIPGAAP